MNHIYRVVYNHHTNTYQAVPEISKGAHKTHSECNQDGTFTQSSLGNVPFFRTALTVLAAIVMTLSAQRAHAAPLGGQVSAGQATIQQNGKVTDIHQTSQKAAINWQKFGIKADETVNFKQPNAQSVTLNRVIGNEKSVIDGAMKANGKVFITNPNGVMIGNGAKINVGALLATTGKISDSDFMAGNYRFQDAKGAVENYGEITVPEGGAVALIAPVVRNQGTIKAPQGNALLASAEQFSVTLQDDNFAYTLDKGTLQGLVDNGGAIYADAGHIVLTAKGVDMVKKSLIKHSGIAEANTVRSTNGVIELLGDLDNSRLEVSGTLKAEAKEQGDGGFVETSAAEVKIQETAKVSTRADNGKSGKWLLDPNDLIIGQGGVMTGGQVNDALKNNGDFELKSTQGKASGKGDVIINDEIQWNRGKLTVNAENDIHINKTLTGTGTASLALEYGQGQTNNFNNTSDYYIQKNIPVGERTAKINLPEGKTFTTKKGSDGETIEFEVVHKMPEIIKDSNDNWVSSFTTPYIALGADIDVSHTRNHNGFAGWGLHDNTKSTQVHGLGHAVDGLYLRTQKDAEYTGLFHTRYNINTKSVRNIGVTNADIETTGRHSYAGALMGFSGDVADSWATGKVSTTGEEANVGGLVGRGYHISNSYANAKVSSVGRNSYTGGLVGSGSNISNSYANAEVSSVGINSYTGGLVGSGYHITNSYANAEVSSVGRNSDAGGLVGSGYNISNSYAIGNVSTTGNYTSTAGLAGNGIDITNSYATGNVSTTGSGALAGGLVGSGSNISNSYATGNVSTTGDYADAAGLAGHGIDITNSYATGNVSTTGDSADASGLVGFGYNISNSYANNQLVTASGQNAIMSGLIGEFDNQYISNFLINNFYNQDKQPNLEVVGGLRGDIYSPVNTINTVGKSDAELKQKSTFTGWDFDTVWRIDEGNDYPRLRALTEGTIIVTPTPPTANKTDVGVQAHDLKKVYDGETVSTEEHLRTIATANGYSDIVSVSGLKDGDTLSSLGGLTYGGTWQGAKNAGQYSIVPSGLNGGQKYEIKYGEGSLTIDKRPLTVSGKKVYDGTNKIDGSKITITPLNLAPKDVLSSDKISVTANNSVGNLSISDVGSGKLDNIGTLSLQGELSENYQLTTGGIWVIEPRDVRISGVRNYDGSTTITAKNLSLSQAGSNDLIDEGIISSDKDKVFISSDSVAVISNKNVGEHELAVTKVNLDGDKKDNYRIKFSLPFVHKYHMGKINPLPVNIGGTVEMGQQKTRLQGKDELKVTNLVSPDDKVYVLGYAYVPSVTQPGVYRIHSSDYSLGLNGENSGNYVVNELLSKVEVTVNPNRLTPPTTTGNNTSTNPIPVLDWTREIDFINKSVNGNPDRLREKLECANMGYKGCGFVKDLTLEHSSQPIGSEQEIYDFKQGSLRLAEEYPELKGADMANLSIALKESVNKAKQQANEYSVNIPGDVSVWIGTGFENSWIPNKHMPIQDYINDVIRYNAMSRAYHEANETYDKVIDFSKNFTNDPDLSNRIQTREGIISDNFVKINDTKGRPMSFIDSMGNSAYMIGDSLNFGYNVAKIIPAYDGVIKAGDALMKEFKREDGVIILDPELRPIRDGIVRGINVKKTLTEELPKVLLEDVPQLAGSMVDLIQFKHEALPKFTKSIDNIEKLVNNLDLLNFSNKKINLSLKEQRKYINNIVKNTNEMKTAMQAYQQIQSIPSYLITDNDRKVLSSIFINKLTHASASISTDMVSLFGSAFGKSGTGLTKRVTAMKDSVIALHQSFENQSLRDAGLKFRAVSEEIKQQEPLMSNILNQRSENIRDVLITTGQSIPDRNDR